MNIKLNEKPLMEFASVIVGETFIYEDCLYIKIRCSDYDINSFNCTRNCVEKFERDTSVQLVNIELREV